MKGVNNRRVKTSRGRFLGGSSGVNGTLCIRGTKQDYDDWGMEEWTGDKMWEYMAEVFFFREFMVKGFVLIDHRPRTSMVKTGSRRILPSTGHPAL